FINLKQNNVLEFWTNNKVLETARKINSGFLLTSAELPLMQLKTRTALLIDCDQLDLLPYTLEASLIIDDILKNIYNIDLFNPPQSILKNKQPFIPYYENKKNWELKNIEEWQNFKKKYNISSILTHNDYSLNLPIIIQDEKYILYGIP
ncbi:MAG TPA: hypothetical protein PLJ38_09325, partial [bacterium]|nr:hypothetical protein [bacterium]